MTWAFEHLRSVIRRDRSSGRELAREVAECLDAFDDDPAALVMACRRLLAQRPEETALWWVSSRVLCAPDVGDEVAVTVETLLDDDTGIRLAEALPFPHDHPVLFYGWSDTLPELAEIRPDLDLVVVRSRGDRTVASRVREYGIGARIVDEMDAAALGASHIVVEPTVLGPATLLVPFGLRDVVDLIGVPLWLVAPHGRVLPDGLARSMERTLGDPWEHDLEPFELDRVARAVGPSGVGPVADIARTAHCPVAGELLRIAL